MAKITTVTLICPGCKRDFEISHAERILRMPNNGGWRLPDDSDFKFDVENGIRYKENKKRIGKAPEKGGYQ